MKTLRAISSITICLALTSLSACASLRGFIYGEEPAPLVKEQPIEKNYGIEVPRQHYYQAYARWPWADGSQLRRRALIVSMQPTNEMYAELDASQSEDLEIRILTELATRNPKRISVNASN